MASRTFPSEHAFLKYQNGEEMAEDEPDPPEEKTIEWMKYWLFRTSDMRFIPDPRLVSYVAEYKKCKRKDPVPWKNMEGFMEILFPTRFWVDNGIRYKQKVSMDMVTRDELKVIIEKLNTELRRRESQTNARYCPIRYGLHMELLDELVRQIALNDPMRAFMIERVRGELNQTLDAFKKVLDVSLVEEANHALDERIDPDVELLNNKLEAAQMDLSLVTEEHENAISDLKEIENKYELMYRIKKQVYEPEIAFTKRLGEALERQMYHFENPPIFETEEEDKK